MNAETVGQIVGIWFLAGIAFCALWAFAHRAGNSVAARKFSGALATASVRPLGFGVSWADRDFKCRQPH